MSFKSLLIQSCDIQEKTTRREGYEVVTEWQDKAMGVPTRKDSDNTPRFDDELMRINTDDDLFFFMPDVELKRGNRIVFEGDNYDVLKVNKLYNASQLHHLEVRARAIDSD